VMIREDEVSLDRLAAKVAQEHAHKGLRYPPIARVADAAKAGVQHRMESSGPAADEQWKRKE
jgi:hypothetical protein